MKYTIDKTISGWFVIIADGRGVAMCIRIEDAEAIVSALQSHNNDKVRCIACGDAVTIDPDHYHCKKCFDKLTGQNQSCPSCKNFESCHPGT